MEILPLLTCVQGSTVQLEKATRAEKLVATKGGCGEGGDWWVSEGATKGGSCAWPEALRFASMTEALRFASMTEALRFASMTSSTSLRFASMTSSIRGFTARYRLIDAAEPEFEAIWK
jgi:hypothetical protein